MRLIFHQALKDVRLLRWLLLAWVGLLVAFHATVLYVVAQPYPAPDLLHRLNEVQIALGVAAVAAFLAIAVLLVQLDSPATTTTFWVTRPVSGRTMLATKLLTVFVVLGLLPVAGDVVDVIAGGLDVRTFASFPFLSALVWLLAPMAIAAVTVGVAQFVIVGIAELLLIVVCVNGARWAGLWNPHADTAAIAYPLAGAAILILGYQYLSRRTTRAAVALGFAPLVVVGVTCLVARAAVDAEAADQPQLRSVSVGIEPSAVRVTERGATSALDIPLTLSGVPDDMSVGIGLRSAWLTVGGEHIDLNGTVRRANYDAEKPGAPRSPVEADVRQAGRALKSALRGATLLPTTESIFAGEREVSAVTRTPAVKLAGAEAALLHLDVRLTPLSYRPVAAAALRPGATLHAPSLSGLVSVDARGNRTTITVRETESWWDWPWPGYTRYLLRNARVNQAALLQLAAGTVAGAHASGLPVALQPMSSPVYVTWRRFDVPKTFQTAWLADAEIVAIRMRLGREVTRTVEVPFTGK